MIRYFLGEDSQRARKDARAIFEQLRAQNNVFVATYFDDILFNFATASEAFTSESLFGGEHILYFDGILDHPDGESFYRTVLKETEHAVIIREAAPSRDLRAFFERLGEVKDYPLIKRVSKRVDSFMVANAIGARDKKASWVEFEKVRRSGVAMEEVHGTIFWCFKSMLLAGTLDKQSALRSGMKDSVYRSYSAFARNYAVDELKDKISQLKEIYHKGHRGEGGIEESLEKFILKN